MPEGPFVNTMVAGGVADIAIAGAVTIYTQAISLKQGEYFSVAYKAASDGNVKLKIEIEQSVRLPTTEEAADSSFITTDEVPAIESALADENWHITEIEPLALPFVRFKITGLGAPSANDATTTLQIKLGILDF